MNRIIVAVLVLLLTGGSVRAWEAEDYEEDAGSSFHVLLNPQDDVYGMAFGFGTWIVNTPIFGDYFIGVFQNDIEDAWYANMGMTIRVMPHWTVAPFVGAGGSYNQSLEGTPTDAETSASPLSFGLTDAELQDLPDRGESYWGGHVEAGVRIWLPPPVQLVELMGRYTWVSLDGDRDYWLAFIGTGTGF